MTETETPDALHDHQFGCETCGSDLRFKPGTDHLTCDHCGNTQEILGGGLWNSGSIKELDFRQAAAKALPEAETTQLPILDCPNCGAQVEFEPDVHAAECPFCATPVVTSTGAHRQIKPRGVLPFALDEGQARAAMNNWLGRLWFAPSGLSAYARAGRAMQGIYVPYWTFDADTRTRYTGERGKVYHETKRVRVRVDGKMETRTRRVSKTRWRPASGQVSRFFDDVLVLASKALPREYASAIAPWDLSELEPYQPEYLAGFRSEAYTIELVDGYDQASAIMDRTIVRDVKFDIGGDKQRIHHLDTDVGAITFKHVLLPVWMAAYKYRGKTYRFLVNGRTGAVKGDRPWSKIKIALVVIAGLLAAAAVGYVVALNQDARAFEVIRIQ